jgi:hypothetical protein
MTLVEAEEAAENESSRRFQRLHCVICRRFNDKLNGESK